MSYLSFNPREKLEITYPFCWQSGTFTDNELDAIVDYCADQTLETGVVVSTDGGHTVSNHRKSEIKFLEPNNVNYWIFEKLGKVATDINDRYYGFELTGFDAIQYTEYNSQGHKYDWHMDLITGPGKGNNLNLTRKLTIIVPLSYTNEYTGGDFQIQNGLPEDPMSIDQTRGTVIAFPSFMIHRVTPILTGVRKSLVIWIVGPKFK
jgi:PKHD-type hydroxylase